MSVVSVSTDYGYYRKRSLHLTELLLHRDIVQQTAVISEVSIAPVLQLASTLPGDDDALQPGPAIKAARILDDGIPVLLTSYHHAFAYHLGMKIWTRVADSWYTVSEFWGSGLQNSPSHPLGWLDSQIRAPGNAISGRSNMGAFARSLANVEKDASGVVTTSHLEVGI
jgi:protein HIRA/HIR1